jgi:hypothetical protein
VHGQILPLRAARSAAWYCRRAATPAAGASRAEEAEVGGRRQNVQLAGMNEWNRVTDADREIGLG